MDGEHGKWIIKVPSGNEKTKLKLVCFPFAGGGTVNYAKWRNDLDSEIDLFAINLPGRERLFGQRGLTDYKQLVKDLAQLISQLPPSPLIFFGHSYGGLTAYFTALELNQNYGITPNHLISSARIPPCIMNQTKLAALDKDQFKQVLIELYDGIPKQILDTPGLIDLFLPILQQDFKLYETFPEVLASYADQKVLCDITSIGYTDDHSKKEQFDNWIKYTTRNYKHIELPGGHFEILANWSAVVSYINHLKSLVS